MDNHPLEIDIVYLWVDGSDPQWLARKNAFLGITSLAGEIDGKGRYANNDELKYSLRSVEKHVPWLRKIFIVTDAQTPGWLNTAHPKIQVVDHREIMPPEALPCYNAFVLEYFLYRIPGLAEHFLFANDDMFFNADLSPDFFFAEDGYPIVRLQKKPFGKWRYRLKRFLNKPLSNYRQTIANASRLVEKKFGKYFAGIPHHNIDAYRKSDYQTAVEEVFWDEIKPIITHHLRTNADIQRAIFLYYALAIGRAHLKYTSPTDSCTIDMDKERHVSRLERFRPKLFCMNDNQDVTDADRKRATSLLENLFPVKSSFEK